MGGAPAPERIQWATTVKRRPAIDEVPRQSARTRAAPWLLAVAAALVVDRALALEWTFPYCSDMWDGPSSAVFGMPLPYERWSGASSLVYDVMPHAWLLDLLLLSLLAYRPARWVWMRAPRRIQRFLGGTAAAVSLVSLAFVLQSIRDGRVSFVHSIAFPPYDTFAKYRPVALVVGRHHDCTPSAWWFGDRSKASQPLARVIEVRPSLESIPYRRLVIVFENTSRQARVVKRYTVKWPGGSKSFSPPPFTLNASGSAHRTLKVFPDAGDLDKLTAASARVQVADAD